MFVMRRKSALISTTVSPQMASGKSKSVISAAPPRETGTYFQSMRFHFKALYS